MRTRKPNFWLSYLRPASYDVLTINEIGLTGCTDDVLLDQGNPSHSGY
jgi:hypothetical protein